MDLKFKVAFMLSLLETVAKKTTFTTLDDELVAALRKVMDQPWAMEVLDFVIKGFTKATNKDEFMAMLNSDVQVRSNSGKDN